MVNHKDTLWEESTGISLNLNKQLRTALLECAPISTDHELKNVFIDNRLSPWRNRLPQANNPTERVESMIHFLHNQHHSDLNKNALVLLFVVLSERLDTADSCRQRLIDLAAELEQDLATKSGKITPKVLVNWTKFERFIPVLNWIAIIAFFANLATIFFYAPTERTMGNVQRIFYFHVGTAWVGAVAFFVALVCGVLYLRRPQPHYDAIALASVEIGLVFFTMAIAAGSVWGKPAWNTWWIWTPRLTLVTIAWLTYAAYFMLRGALEDEEKRARFSAVYVIIAFVTIIMAYVSIRLVRDIHPVVVGGTLESAQGAEEGLQDFAPGLESMKMGITLTVSVSAFTLLYVAWLVNRMRLQRLLDEANLLKMRVSARLSG